MKPSYIKLAPVTSTGKFQICKLQINSSYMIIAECKREHFADCILQALLNDEFTSKIVAVQRQITEAA